MSRPPSRRDTILGLLCFAAGSIDALSFADFNVFTSAMSGNTVLLGIAIGQLRWTGAIGPALAFLGYALGVALGTVLVGNATEEDDANLRLRRPLTVQTLVLAAFAGLHIAAPPTSLAVGWSVFLAAGGMGVQGATARHVQAPGVNTVVFTSTLTLIIGAFAAAALKIPRRIGAETWLQTRMFLIYLAGACASAALSHFGRPASVLPVACAALAATLSRSRKDRARHRPPCPT